MMHPPVSVDVCICTFRRPMVVQTLASVAAQRLGEGCRAAILVIDNDDAPTARAGVERFAATCPLPLRYIHAPGRNISLARNAAFEQSCADMLAMIDDDEEAATDWLHALLSVQAESGAEAVLGPVEAVYDPGAPRWMREAQVHATLPVVKGGRIVTGYTGNTLIDRRRPEIAALRFDPTLGRTGGEDTEFFARFLALGGRIAFAPEARAREAVPADRARLRWLLRRRWRMGVSHVRAEVGGSGGGRLRTGGLALAKAAACAGGAALAPHAAARRNHFLMRGALHLGAVWATLGGGAPEMYGNDPADAAR